MKPASFLTRLQFSYTVNLLQAAFRRHRRPVRLSRTVESLHHAR